MADPDVRLDRQDLVRLRDVVRRAAEPTTSLDRGHVLAIHDAAPRDAGLTVDFEAAQDLGMPLLVVRVPFHPSPAPVLAVLTPRELEVAGYVAGGFANKEIAARLGIRESTVKEHVHRILAKTDLPSRAAIARAYAGGADRAGAGAGSDSTDVRHRAER